MEQSPLFRLPRELRDEIYKYALYHAGGLLYTIGKKFIFSNPEIDLFDNCVHPFPPGYISTQRLTVLISASGLGNWSSAGLPPFFDPQDTSLLCP